MRQHRIHAAAYDTMTRPLERAILSERRARLLTGLTGQILDIGTGTGASLSHYQQASQGHRRRARSGHAQETDRQGSRRGRARHRHQRYSRNLHHPDASFDTVVFTLVLCSVTDPAKALAEARRVL